MQRVENSKTTNMGRLLRILGIGWKGARFSAICSLAFLSLLGWLAWDFHHSPAGLTPLDIGFFVGAGLIAAAVMFASGWLGFTDAGRRYSEQLFDREYKEFKVVRIGKVAFAAGAIAFAASELLFVALLYAGGPDSVMIFFEGKTEEIIFGVFFLLSLPFVSKYLK